MTLPPQCFYSCPEQLNRTPCLSLGPLPLTIRVFTTLQSEEPWDFETFYQSDEKTWLDQKIPTYLPTPGRNQTYNRQEPRTFTFDKHTSQHITTHYLHLSLSGDDNEDEQDQMSTWLRRASQTSARLWAGRGRGETPFLFSSVRSTPHRRIGIVEFISFRLATMSTISELNSVNGFNSSHHVSNFKSIKITPNIVSASCHEQSIYD